MSEQLKASTVRSLYGGALLGGAAITKHRTSRGDAYRLEDTILAFLVTFVG